jgi:hypothetical protein
MIYGMIASNSVILSNIADPFKENIGKDNTVECLSGHLKGDLPRGICKNFSHRHKGRYIAFPDRFARRY